MLAALLALAVFAQTPPAAAGARVVILPLDATAEAVEPALAGRLSARGALVVAQDAVLAPLRTAATGSPAWRAALEAEARGLQAEQDLDLATARRELTAARDALFGLGAPFVDTSGYAGLLAALARVEDEQGDAASADETLRAWAALPVPQLDERTFPPALVSRSVKAREQVSPRAVPVPLPWVWQSGAVDAAVTMQASGPPGGETLVMLWYKRGETAPQRAASAGLFVDPAMRASALERAVDVLLPPPTPAVASPAAPTPNELAHEVVLGASLVFPTFEAYSRAGVSTAGIGLALSGRYVGERGPAYGGRVDLTWGGVDVEQATATARWTAARGPWRFSLEPGVGLQLRQQSAWNAMNERVTTSDVGLVLEAGGYIGLRLGEVAQLEEGLTLGFVPLQTSYDTNVPVSFRTTLAFVF